MREKSDQIKSQTLIAMPVYNEAEHLEEIIDTVKRYCENLIVIDDGSTDGSFEKLLQFSDIEILRHGRNTGYGSCMIDAFEQSMENDYKWLITIDCDGQHEPQWLEMFYEVMARDEYDVISGSRYLHQTGDDLMCPPERKYINKKITGKINRLTDFGLTDSFCGLKAYRVEKLQGMSLTETGYAFPLQFWVEAFKAGLEIKEIPVEPIYLDNSRCFGGDLDDHKKRYRYYLKVLKRQWLKR